MLLHSLCASLLPALAFTKTIVQSPTPANEAHQLLPRTGDERRVYAQFKFNFQKKLKDDLGIDKFPGHSALWIAGTKTDGPIQIEIFSADREKPKLDRPLEVRVYEKPTADPAELPRNHGPYESFEHGTTTMTNEDIVNHETGEGPVLEALKEFKTYRSGPQNKASLNTCHDYITQLLKRIPSEPQDPNEKTQEHFKTYDELSALEKYNEYNFNKPVSAMNIYKPSTDPANPTRMKRWTIEELGCGRRRKGKRDGCTINLKANDDAPTTKGQNEYVMNDWTSDLPDDELSITSGDDSQTKSISTDGLSEADKVRKVGMVRTAGTITTFTMFSKAALIGLGVAGDIVGAAFIILDLVHKEWAAAAIGGVSMAAGLAAGFAVGGPIGWVIGGVVATLMAILPGLGHNYTPADRIDVQGIIQYKMFGDKTHTGNEKCQKGDGENPGNKDCQVLYGAGTISMALGMSNFDTIVFLTQFNAGYAMTIPEMAKNFYVIDENEKGDGADQMATISCHAKQCNNPIRGCLTGTDITQCEDPTFAIIRQNIKLATFDQTADKLHDRIIPNQNGDCKLVTYPGDMVYPRYDLTMNGQPSSIACGITSGINVQGTSVDNAIEAAPDGAQANNVSPGDQSTTGENGASVKPPPPAPFAPLTQEKYLCIYKDGENPACFPPGDYYAQSKMGFENSAVDSMSLPPQPGWSLIVHWTTGGLRRRGELPIKPQKTNDDTFDRNVSPKADHKKSADLNAYMSGISNLQDNGPGTFTVKAPDDGPDAVCCLFSDVSFKANVLCLGQGGGDLPDNWKKVPQSVSCHAGGAIWLYAESYGDKTGAQIKGNVEDLKNELLGPDNGSFSKNVTAVWVGKA